MGAPVPANVLAKAALKRLALDKAEPTPDNYRRAYELEAGVTSPPTPASESAATAPSASDNIDAEWADVLERVVKQLDRSTKLWTPARKKDSLHRIFESSRLNPARLQQRLSQLLSSWENNREEDGAQGTSSDLVGLITTQPAPLQDVPDGEPKPLITPLTLDPDLKATRPLSAGVWPQAMESMRLTLQSALPATEPRAQEATQSLERSAQNLVRREHQQALDEFRAACTQAQRVIEHRNHLVQQITQLCGTLAEGLTDLAEDDSWVQGQAHAMREQIKSGLTARSVRRIQELLDTTRRRQAELREQHRQARQALKDLIHQMLSEIAELGSHTGRFQDHLGRYADTIGQAESLESLAGVVREMVEESRTVQTLVSQTQERLHSEHARATELSQQVKSLEEEIKRLSDEVSTDPLTQVANRRGLMRTFDQEIARMARDGGRLAVALLDIDNFKKLNDSMGHQAGDEALKFLSQRVQQSLRPGDTLARFGGEEFVVLLPNTPLDEAQVTLTRLQRELSAELFMHEDQQTFITFSAGVTLYREDDSLESVLDRADEALYEAKHTGKNRTCVA